MAESEVGGSGRLASDIGQRRLAAAFTHEERESLRVPWQRGQPVELLGLHAALAAMDSTHRHVEVHLAVARREVDRRAAEGSSVAEKTSA